MAKDTQEIEIETQHVQPLSTATNKLTIKDFVWSKDEWPAIEYDDFAKGDEIPVISFSKALRAKNYDAVCEKMVDACEKFGFFVLVDHGVHSEIIENVREKCAKLFDLPMDQKMRGGRTASLPLGYSASNPGYGHNLPWAEIIQLLQSSQQVVSFAQKIYGDQHQSLSEAINEYMHALDGLGMAILEALAHGLGLQDDYFSKNFRDHKESTMIRINCYPPCPLPEKCLGLGSHSDPHTLTILWQDEVGGLQIQKSDSEWFGIRPVPSSLIINIGDTLEAWTNGRLKSSIHRAVVNKEKKRMSLAYFMSPEDGTYIDCPVELVGEDSSGRKYAAFSWGEFKRELLIQKRVVGKTALNRYLIF
ncbi:gibberellin 20 oxidase 1-like [Typha latifolia]|uniref:gibberellin 20 oxidase 1-like n=1 Tax=Typha latifolia TaxID=4733 RepID=UPI003C302296